MTRREWYLFILALLLISGKILADDGGAILIGQGGTGTGTAFTAGSFIAAGSTAYTNVPTTYTKTQFNTLVPDGVGEVFVCSNCSVPYVLCIATGTTVGQFSAMKTGNGCGSNN